MHSLPDGCGLKEYQDLHIFELLKKDNYIRTYFIYEHVFLVIIISFFINRKSEILLQLSIKSK